MRIAAVAFLVFIGLLIEGLFVVPGIFDRVARQRFEHAKWPTHPVDRKHIYWETPVLVVTPARVGGCKYSAAIVYYEDLKQYISTRPKYSFLVPQGADTEMNRQVARQGFTDREKRRGRFELQRLADGRQKLRVFGSYYSDERGEVVFSSWYIASRRSFVPYGWTTYCEGNNRFCAMLLMIPVNLVAYCIFLAVYSGRRARRQRAVGTTETRNRDELAR